MQTHQNGLRIYTQCCSRHTQKFSALRVITCWTLTTTNVVCWPFFLCSFIRSYSFLLLLCFFVFSSSRFISYFYSLLAFDIHRLLHVSVWLAACAHRISERMNVSARVSVYLYLCLDSYGIRWFEWETVPRVSMTMSICNECYMCYGLLILALSPCRVYYGSFRLYSLQLEHVKEIRCWNSVQFVYASIWLFLCISIRQILKWIVLFLRRV